MGKYLDLIRQHERTQPDEAVTPQQAINPAFPVHPGDRIEWHRADGLQQGVVDYIHADADGRAYAYVLSGETWAVVNLKGATVRTDADLTHLSTAKTGACFACQSTRTWTSIYGAVLCGTCHPPASPHLVREWREGM